MNLERLHKYRELSELSDCIAEQLEAKEVHDAVIGDSGAPAFSKVTRAVEGYVHGLGTIKLLSEQHKICAEMQYIENYISAIPIWKYRRALEMYCLDMTRSWTWPQISEKLNCSGDIRRNIANYLKKLPDPEEM